MFISKTTTVALLVLFVGPDVRTDTILPLHQQEPSVFKGYSVSSADLELSKGRHKNLTVLPAHVGNIHSTTPPRTLPDIVLPNNIVFLPNAPTTIDSREQDPPQKEGTAHPRKRRQFFILIFLLVGLMMAGVIAVILLSTIYRHKLNNSNTGDAILGLPTTNSPTMQFTSGRLSS